jgi:predicted nucleic acid-binding protein
VAREAIVDSNVLLRYLTNEPRLLADRAAAILEEAEARRLTLVVVPLVLAEVVYVLEKVYNWSRPDIANRLLDFLAASVVDFIDSDAVTQTLVWYRDIFGLDFADAYVCAMAIARGHGLVVSFDRDLVGLAGVSVITQASQLS